MLTRMWSEVSPPAVSFFLSVAALTTAWVPPPAMADERRSLCPLGPCDWPSPRPNR